MIEVMVRADEIIPGEKVASDVLGFFDTVVSVRVIEHTTGSDEIEIVTDSQAMSPTLVRRAGRMIRTYR